MPDNIDYSYHYRKWHDGSRSELEERILFYDRLIGKEISEFPSNTSFLDYGCGFGHLVYYLSRKFENVAGVDSSPHQIAAGKANNLPVELVEECVFDDWIKRHSNSFDVIFIMDVLEHIPHDEQIEFLTKINKLLKDDGLLYVKTPNANSLLASRWRYIDWTHTTSFTEHSLEFTLHNAGFMDFSYLDDESSFRPKFPYIPRWGTLPFYLRCFVRFLWRFYIYSEIGREALRIPLGVNLFVKSRKQNSHE